MKYGDLSNQLAPRIIIVFDDCIACIPDENRKAFDKFASKGNYQAAIPLMIFNEMMFRKLLDLSWRKNININLVTWMGDKMAAALSEWCAENMIPVRGCFASKPDVLARMLPYNPDVVAIYDPDPAHVFTYGSKGVLLKDPNQIGSMF